VPLESNSKVVKNPLFKGQMRSFWCADFSHFWTATGVRFDAHPCHSPILSQQSKPLVRTRAIIFERAVCNPILPPDMPPDFKLLPPKVSDRTRDHTNIAGFCNDDKLAIGGGGGHLCGNGLTKRNI
jgi:hypothetical protein